MLEQTKNAYAALIAVGLKRGQFSVKCPMTRKGYGDVQIVLYTTPYHLAEELAKEFKVSLFTTNGEYRGPVLLEQSNKPGLTITRMDDDE